MTTESLLRFGAFVGFVGIWYLFFGWLWSRLKRPKRRLFGDASGEASLVRGIRRVAVFSFKHLFLLICAVGTTATLLNVYVYHGFGHQPDIYRKGSRERPWVALTFDDGPSPQYTPRILALLEAYEVPAAFFMVGAHVEAYPEIAQAVVAAGHEVGNHTYTHINVPTASTQRLYEELLGTSLVILEVTGVYPEYIRPPRGLYDGRFGRMAALLGQKIVLWNRSSLDWQGTRITSQAIVRRIVDQVRAGDILLFHDSGAILGREGGNREMTVRALEEIILGVRAKGLEFVSLSQLLQGVEGEESPPHDLVE